jgi:DNA topoisomerase-2
MAGIGQVGRDHYGVFPLRGKLLNVREANTKQLTENAEIQNIKKILGLQHEKNYDSTNGLRYGHLMIMTDQVCLATSPVLSRVVKIRLFLGLL